MGVGTCTRQAGGEAKGRKRRLKGTVEYVWLGGGG